MKRFLGLLSLFIFPSLSHAQVGKMNWNFRSRSEVVPALKSTRGNLRKTYDVLVCANRQGYGTTSVRFYEDFVLGHTFDASSQDCAAFAFAYDLSHGFHPWNWKKDLNPETMKSDSGQALYFRDRALSLNPTNPEVLTMRAFWGALQGSKESRKDGYESALKAIKGAPKWGDAYYWLGYATHTYAITFEGDRYPIPKDTKIRQTRSRLGRLAMRAYDNAEKLDPSLRPHLYLERLGLSDLIADKKSAQMIPVYLDAHLKAFPQYSAWLEKRWGESEQKLRQRYSDLAAKINSQLSE